MQFVPVQVYVVDDDFSMRERLRSAVAQMPGLRVCGSSDTVQGALRWLDSNRADVLLVDLGLPDGSGLEVIRRTAVRDPGCDIVVITAFGDEASVLTSLRAGACGYLLKDHSDEELAAHLTVLRHGGAPITPVIARRLLTAFQREAAPGARAQPGRPAAPDALQAVDLSERERQALQHVAKGFSNAEIALLMEVSVHTVATFIKRIYAKLAVRSRTQAVYEAQRIGLIDAD